MNALLLMNMLEKAQSRLEHLSKSERKVTEVILATSAQAIHSSIATLAFGAGVNGPTVSRFCRSLEARKFPGFRLRLAQSLMHGTLCVNQNIDEDGNVEPYTGETFESTVAGLNQVHHSLDMSAMNHAVGLLIQAKKAVFFSLGSSAVVTYNAMSKFLRFSISTTYSNDIVLQRMNCMSCDNDDVVAIISHAGRTRSLVELAQLAREDDAMVTALTSANTPLARETTLVTTLGMPEDTDIYMPMVSRFTQLTIINVLATGSTLRRGAELRNNLGRVREALKESRFDKEPFVLSDNQ